MTEEMQQDFQESRQNVLSNQAYSGATIIQLRLDTEPLIEKTELYLSALKKIQFYNTTTQTVEEKLTLVGKPKANKEGIQAIITFLQSFINSQSVQGNLDEPRLYGIIADARMDMTKMILISRKDWDIDPKEMDAIIQFNMNMIKLFLTRTKDNLERDSYTTTFKSSEVQTMKDKSSGFNWNPFSRSN